MQVCVRIHLVGILSQAIEPVFCGYQGSRRAAWQDCPYNRPQPLSGCPASHSHIRINLTPLAKQLFRMQRDLTPHSTNTFSATGNRYAFPNVLQPEALPHSPLAPSSRGLCPGRLEMTGQFDGRLTWTPWTRPEAGSYRKLDGHAFGEGLPHSVVHFLTDGCRISWLDNWLSPRGKGPHLGLL